MNCTYAFSVHIPNNLRGKTLEWGCELLNLIHYDTNISIVDCSTSEYIEPLLLIVNDGDWLFLRYRFIAPITTEAVKVLIPAYSSLINNFPIRNVSLSLYKGEK